MGARLVNQAITYALPVGEYTDHRGVPRRVTHASRTLLLVMCQMAKDNDSNPVYFAGSEHLARALGYSASEGVGLSKEAEQAVLRALRELICLGFVEQQQGLARTWKRRWLITLPGLPCLRVVDFRPDTGVGT